MRLWTRRRFLQISGLAALAGLWTGTANGAMFFLKKFLSLPPRDTPPLTPNSEFYVYDIGRMSRMIQDLDYSGWRLLLGGRVRRPLSLSREDLAKRPSRDLAATLECIENPVGGDSIGTAVWRGVPLRDLLLEAGGDPSAKKVIFKAADGYTDSIPVSRARMGDVLLAYEMNGVALPREHGYPLRAVVPGIYGMKNVKWILEIEVTDADYLGYWQQRGWSDDAVIGIMSRIDRPGRYQELKGLDQPIRGIAFAGAAGVRRVEVSTDGGRGWNPAAFDPPLSLYAWVLWRFDWKAPRPGVYQLLVRATDGKGRVQPSENRPAFPDGPAGLHAVTVEIVASS